MLRSGVLSSESTAGHYRLYYLCTPHDCFSIPPLLLRWHARFIYTLFRVRFLFPCLSRSLWPSTATTTRLRISLDLGLQRGVAELGRVGSETENTAACFAYRCLCVDIDERPGLVSPIYCCWGRREVVRSIAVNYSALEGGC